MVREQREQQEEKLALMELRRAVQQMQGVEQDRTAQEEAVVTAVGKLGDKMQKLMEHDMEARAAGVMQSIDFEQVLTGAGEGTRGHIDSTIISGTDSKNVVTTPQKPRRNGGGGSTKRKKPTPN